MKTALLACALAGAAAAKPVALYPRQNSTAASGANWDSIRKNIKHVIYLMEENHSFDNIAGDWSFNKNIDNIRNSNVDYCNNYTNPLWTVWGEPLEICATPYENEVPLTDPDHNFAGTSYEIYGKWNPGKNDTPTMGGFIERQSDKYNATPGDTAFVIQYYSEQKSSMLATLAQNYGFFDAYHAEHPGPTNPNRQFATSGSTCGMVDNTNQASGWFANVTGTTCATSIFEALDKKNISWTNYYETDIIDAYMYKYVQDNAMSKLKHADQFYVDLEQGTLPQFSYINPECCTIDSMHPTSNMAAGEQMLKHLYDSVRASKYWDSTLLIINFDEHGGFADHVLPPTNIPAPEDGMTFSGVSDKHNVTYDFTRLGVRVPAFVISPYIAPNTLIHNDGTSYGPSSYYTHSSFLHFLQELWGLEGLNNRVQIAKTFEHVFQDTMREDTPETMPVPRWIGGAHQTEPAPFGLLNQDAAYYGDS